MTSKTRPAMTERHGMHTSECKGDDLTPLSSTPEVLGGEGTGVAEHMRAARERAAYLGVFNYVRPTGIPPLSPRRLAASPSPIAYSKRRAGSGAHARKPLQARSEERKRDVNTALNWRKTLGFRAVRPARESG